MPPHQSLPLVTKGRWHGEAVTEGMRRCTFFRTSAGGRSANLQRSDPLSRLRRQLPLITKGSRCLFATQQHGARPCLPLWGRCPSAAKDGEGQGRSPHRPGDTQSQIRARQRRPRTMFVGVDAHIDPRGGVSPFSRYVAAKLRLPNGRTGSSAPTRCNAKTKPGGASPSPTLRRTTKAPSDRSYSRQFSPPDSDYASPPGSPCFFFPPPRGRCSRSAPA